MKAGDVIKIEDPLKVKTLRSLAQDMLSCDVGMMAMARQKRALHKGVWRTLNALYPELKDFEGSYDYDTGEIYIKYERMEWEKAGAERDD